MAPDRGMRALLPCDLVDLFLSEATCVNVCPSVSTPDRRGLAYSPCCVSCGSLSGLGSGHEWQALECPNRMVAELGPEWHSNPGEPSLVCRGSMGCAIRWLWIERSAFGVVPARPNVVLLVVQFSLAMQGRGRGGGDEKCEQGIPRVTREHVRMSGGPELPVSLVQQLRVA